MKFDATMQASIMAQLNNACSLRATAIQTTSGTSKAVSTTLATSGVFTSCYGFGHASQPSTQTTSKMPTEVLQMALNLGSGMRSQIQVLTNSAVTPQTALQAAFEQGIRMLPVIAPRPPRAARITVPWPMDPTIHEVCLPVPAAVHIEPSDRRGAASGRVSNGAREIPCPPFVRDTKRLHSELSFLLGLFPPGCQGKRQESERSAGNNRSGHRGRNLFAQCHEAAEADDGDGD